MIGNSWWSDVTRRGEEPKLCPPRVVVSISGEPAPQEGSIEWTSATGKAFDVSDPPTGTTYIGRCVGKQLFISDVDEKKKKVEALVKIMAPSSDDEPERVIGTFPSRPIKVISKPSKKRQSAKNLERESQLLPRVPALRPPIGGRAVAVTRKSKAKPQFVSIVCINHGSTISLFHRLRSQTVSTKYLCVSGSGSSFKGSDGAPLMGLDQRSRAQTPSFIARTASWGKYHCCGGRSFHADRCSAVRSLHHVHRGRQQARRGRGLAPATSASTGVPLAAAKRDPFHQQRLADPRVLQPDRRASVLDVWRGEPRAHHPQGRPPDDRRRWRSTGRRQGHRRPLLCGRRSVRRPRLAAAQDRV